MRDHSFEVNQPLIVQTLITAEEYGRPILMSIYSFPRCMRFRKTLGTHGICFGLPKAELFSGMLELHMHGQRARLAISKKENRVRFETFASRWTTGACTVFATPIIRPKWLLGPTIYPPYRFLFIVEAISVFVLNKSRRSFKHPIPNFGFREESACNCVKERLRFS